MRLYFIETREFIADIASMQAEAALQRLQQELLEKPIKGVVIKGCGGIRKVRMEDASRSKGKRSGVRVIYLHVPEVRCVYFLAVFSKDEKIDLDVRERQLLSDVAENARAELIRLKSVRWKRNEK